MGRTFPTHRGLAWFVAVAVVLVVVLGAASVWSLDRAVAAEPTDTTSVVRVRTGGDREAGGTVAPLPGVTLAAYTNAANSSPADPDDATVEVARCVADAQGLCDIVFSGTAGPDGENFGKRFWVKQVNVLPDYDPNHVLRTGATGATPAYVTPYAFRTPALVAGQTYTSGSAQFMDSSGVNANNRLASTGTWQSSRLNPALAPQCGLDVALIADWSSSVAVGDPTYSRLKGALDAVVDSLTGTPSRLSYYAFGYTSPLSATDGRLSNITTPVGVSTAQNAQTLKEHWAGWGAPGGPAVGTQATNWDAGLRAAMSGPTDYDLAVVLTDGNPTVHGADPGYVGYSSTNQLADVEAAIFSANGLRAQGTRVVALGVGDGVAPESHADLNLAAVSGPVRYDGTNPLAADYYQTTDYTAAAGAIRRLAAASCQGQLTIVKQVVRPGGSIENQETVVAGPGWQITVTGEGVGGTQTTTTDQTGAVQFDLSSSDAQALDLHVAERQFPGYEMLAVDQSADGPRALCRSIGTGQEYPVVNDPDNPAAFTVQGVEPFGATTCTIYNQAPEGSTSVQVNKEWVIDGAPPVPDGAQPPGISASLSLAARPGGAPSGPTASMGEVAFGSAYAQYGDAGEILQPTDGVVINEETAVSGRPLCEVVPGMATIRGVDEDGEPTADVPLRQDHQVNLRLQPEFNVYTITNHVQCRSLLTLAKEVSGGDADASGWTLAAGSQDPDLPGFSGTAGSAEVTSQPVRAETPYVLTESGGDPRYVQDDFRTPDADGNLPYPDASGSWVCRYADDEADAIPHAPTRGEQGAVLVPVGRHMACTAVNRTATLTLAKDVVNDDGTAVPSDWSLTLTPEGPDVPADLEPVTVTGNTDGPAVLLRPGTPYRISETGPDGYHRASFLCNTDGVLSDDNTVVTLGTDHSAGAGVDCRVTNDDDGPPTLTLVKTVDGGPAAAEDWTLTADGPASMSGVTGSDAVTAVEVPAGEYVLAESSDDTPDYEPGAWDCTLPDGTPVPVTHAQAGPIVTLAVEQDVTCAIVNTFVPSSPTPEPTPTLTPTPEPTPTGPVQPPSKPAPPGSGADAGPSTPCAPATVSGGCPDGTLPVTGANAWVTALAAAAFVALGLMLVRRRRAAVDRTAPSSTPSGQESGR